MSGCSDGLTTVGGSSNTEQVQNESVSSANETSVDELDNDKQAQVEEQSQDSSEDSTPGSRTNPLPLSGTVILESSGLPEWEIKVLSVDAEAEGKILETNQFNAASPDGIKYVLVTLEMKYLGADRGQPGFDINLAYVTKEGTTHKPTDISLVIEDDIFSINELYSGASAVGSEVVAIPEEDLFDGTWRVSGLFSNEVYLEGK